MQEALIVVLGLSVCVVLAVLIMKLPYWIDDWRHRERRTPAVKAEEAAAYRDRLLNPRWDEVGRVTGGSPSPALVELYSDQELLLSHELSVQVDASSDEGPDEEVIAEFRPADRSALEDEWCRYLPPGSFPFATDDFGDLLFVGMDADGRDGEVKHWYHDGGDVETVAPSLQVFLQWCRRDKARAIRGG